MYLENYGYSQNCVICSLLKLFFDMKFRLLFIPLLLIAYLPFTGCVNNSEEELYGEDCDTLNMTYSKVKYIFENNCYACHSADLYYRDIKTDTYEDLKAAINTGRPWGAINRFDGYLPMPNGQPKLDDCLIKKIGAWIHAGMPE